MVRKLCLRLREKTTYRMGESICKWHNQQGLNLQYVQTAHTTQEQINQTTPIEKCAEGFKTFLLTRQTDDH